MSLADISKDQQIMPWIFFFLPIDSMLVIRFVPDEIRKCIRNCENVLKINFKTLFLPKTKEKSKIDQNTKRETYETMFFEQRLKCFLNITVLMFFGFGIFYKKHYILLNFYLIQNWQQELNSNSHHFLYIHKLIYKWHITTSQIKNIQQI